MRGNGVKGGDKDHSVKAELAQSNQTQIDHKAKSFSLNDLLRLNLETHAEAVMDVVETATKELIIAVLSSEYETLCTQGNLNNHIGVPLTLLRLQPCLLYTSPSPRDKRQSRMPSSA